VCTLLNHITNTELIKTTTYSELESNFANFSLHGNYAGLPEIFRLITLRADSRESEILSVLNEPTLDENPLILTQVESTIRRKKH
jgi:hypothetical protein